MIFSIVSIFHIAFEPMKTSFDITASIRAMSIRSPSLYISILLSLVTYLVSSNRPEATAAAAMPATVPSSMVGYTLLVPVEIVIMGVFFKLFAAALLVPSPPNMITHLISSFFSI